MEQWKDIHSHIGLYQVSDDGNVRRLHTLVQSLIDSGVRRPKNVLKPQTTSKGYSQVTLSKHGVITRCHVHVLVLEAFAGERPDRHEGKHLDNDMTRNCIDNLAWKLFAKDMKRAGGASTRARLTETDVRAIRASQDDQRALAVQFGVSQATISMILDRKTWRHI